MQPTNRIGSTARNVILGIIFIGIVLRVLLNLQQDSREIVLRDPFLLAHSLDPNYGPDAGYRSWRRSQWEEWLTQREPLHRSAANAVNRRRKHPLNRKPVNTVIIGTPDEIQAAFTGTLDPQGSYYFWSNRMFEIFDIRRTSGGHLIIFRCPPTYISVGMLAGKPVHLNGYSDVKTASGGNLNYERKKKCVQLN